MKLSLFLAFGLAMAASAHARPNTQNMTCGEAQSLVQSHGAIVLSTGANTYDRFVAHQGYCALGERAVTAWVRTSNSSACAIGYVCRNRDK